MNINLNKNDTRKIVNITLTKRGFNDVKAKVAIVIDSSGSMYHLYTNGTVQALVNRALAVGYKFDDDGSIDVFDFADHNHHNFLGQATQDDGEHFLDNYQMISGGTVYSYVLNRIADYYYTKSTSGGFLGFGKKVTAPEGRDGMEDNIPVFVIFITDGGTLYEGEDQRGLKQILNAHKDMFVSFVGIGSAGSFSFLRNQVDKYRNASFFNASDIKNIDDTDLMDGILPEKARIICHK